MFDWLIKQPQQLLAVQASLRSQLLVIRWTPFF